MPTFAYTAIEPGTGRECHGSIASASHAQAATELKYRGLALTALAVDSPPKRKQTHAEPSPDPGATRRARYRMTRSRPRFGLGAVVSRKGLTRFTRQLAALVKAGLPILRALEVLARPERNQAFKAVITDLAGTIRGGGNLSDGLQQHPRIFDPLYVTMVKAGEAGGVLDSTLDRLARFLERIERIKGRVKAAMTYPVIILLVAGGILTGLMVFVVPKFEQIFSGLLKGQPLPPLTRLVLGMSNFVGHHLTAVLGLVILAWLAGRWVRKTRVGTRLKDWLLIKSPVLGEMLLKAAIARFTRTFGSLLASGVPILDALVITRDTSGNVHVAEALNVVRDRVKGGAMVAPSLEATAVFPGLVTSMIEVGEETGDLPGMLARIADTYDEEVDNAVAALTSLIEPLMIVFMAMIVGAIVIALFLPIVSIIQHLQ